MLRCVQDRDSFLSGKFRTPTNVGGVVSQRCTQRPPDQTVRHGVQNGDSNAEAGVSATDGQLATTASASGLRRTQPALGANDRVTVTATSAYRRPSDPRSARAGAAEVHTAAAQNTSAVTPRTRGPSGQRFSDCVPLSSSPSEELGLPHRRHPQQRIKTDCVQKQIRRPWHFLPSQLVKYRDAETASLLTTTLGKTVTFHLKMILT